MATVVERFEAKHTSDWSITSKMFDYDTQLGIQVKGPSGSGISFAVKGPERETLSYRSTGERDEFGLKVVEPVYSAPGPITPLFVAEMLRALADRLDPSEV